MLGIIAISTVIRICMIISYSDFLLVSMVILSTHPEAGYYRYYELIVTGSLLTSMTILPKPAKIF